MLNRDFFYEGKMDIEIFTPAKVDSALDAQSVAILRGVSDQLRGLHKIPMIGELDAPDTRVQETLSTSISRSATSGTAALRDLRWFWW